ncbi:MAG: FAD/NAD(P)-binding protein [Pseudomonadota bacterium]
MSEPVQEKRQMRRARHSTAASADARMSLGMPSFGSSFEADAEGIGGRRTLVIVGGGATGAAGLDQAVRDVARLGCGRRTRIVVIDGAEVPFRRLAYATPLASHIMNMPLETLVTDPERPLAFWDHLVATGQAPPALPVNQIFPPRAAMGTFLEQEAARAIAAGRANGVEIDILRDRVVDLVPGARITLVTDFGRRIAADRVLLALGNQASTATERFRGHPALVPSPYDVVRIAEIPKHAQVAILGTSLSMIDAVLALEALGHEGTVLAVSRSGRLPDLRRPVYPALRLRHLCPRRLAAAGFGAGRRLSASQTVRLWRREAARFGIDRRIAGLAPPAPGEAAVAHLAREAAAADLPCRLPSLIQAVSDAAPALWAMQTETARRWLMSRLGTEWAARAYPCPPVNGCRLLDWLRSGRLAVARCDRAGADGVEIALAGGQVAL